MADTKVTALAAKTAATADDLLYLVDDPAGTPASKKITFANLESSLTVANMVGGSASGTGNLLRVTSPTMVTPVLGVPTSGTLTNCDGLPMETGVTGVLPIANGGTETSTAPTSGQVLIGKADGTYAVAAITAGSGMTVTPGDGTITLASTAAGAASGANADITSLSALSGVLKAPTMVQDSSGNEVVKFTGVASAVNELTITNSANSGTPELGNPVKIDVTGDDDNCGLLVTLKGTGALQVAGAAGLITATGGVAIYQKPRVVTTTDDATAIIDVTITDVYELSAVANPTTFSTTGTPLDGQKLMIRFKAAGAQALTWDGIFVAIGVTAPTVTVAGKWHYVFAQYNSAATKFHILATAVQA